LYFSCEMEFFICIYSREKLALKPSMLPWSLIILRTNSFHLLPHFYSSETYTPSIPYSTVLYLLTLGIQWPIHVEIAAWYDSIMGVREGMSGTRLVVRMEQNSVQQNKCSSNNPVSPTPNPHKRSLLYP